MRAIYRYEIPVDDRSHAVNMHGSTRVLHVAARRPNIVEFWAEHDGPTLDRWFRVFGTGQPLPEDWMKHRYIGTALAADGQLVWHLYESMQRVSPL